jgi:hypothetical protein
MKSDKGCCQTHPPCLYCLILLACTVPFIVIFVVLNDKFLSYNNICCTTQQVLKQLIKPHQAHDFYLTKEQQLQGRLIGWSKIQKLGTRYASGGCPQSLELSQSRTGRTDRASRRCTTMGRTVTSARLRGRYDTLFLSFCKFFVLTCL